MALRKIRIMGDPVLTKKCKPVKEMTPRIQELIEDMFETMYMKMGVGLAAPQVGILPTEPQGYSLIRRSWKRQMSRREMKDV